MTDERLVALGVVQRAALRWGAISDICAPLLSEPRGYSGGRRRGACLFRLMEWIGFLRKNVSLSPRAAKKHFYVLSLSALLI